MKREYKPIALTVDTIIFSRSESGIKTLLIKRKKPPFQDKWAIPGGFINYDEELKTAAKRELEEETGLKNASLNQLHTFGRIGRDPRGRTVTVVYYAFVEAAKVKLQAGDDAKEAEWFDLNDLPELAFDHKGIIEYAVEKCLKQ